MRVISSPCIVFICLVILLGILTTTGLSIPNFRSLDFGNRAAEEEADGLVSIDTSEDGNKCCARQSRKHFVGYGLDGEQLFVDLGQCRQSCSSKKAKIHRKEFDALLKANATVDPVQLFLSMQRDVSAKSCDQDSQCLPTRTVVERHMTMSGLEEVAVIEDCACLPQHHYCNRVAEHVVKFPGTPFEAVVDVGRCTGSCNSEMRCRSVQNKTVAISGPNGAVCVEVIEKCGCTSSCYRSSSMEQIYDYPIPSSSEEDRNEQSGPTIKVIDVGKCVGECSSWQPKKHCVLRDTDDSTKCLMSLTRRENNCVPLGFQMHRYRSKSGNEKSILSITDCGCQ